MKLSTFLSRMTEAPAYTEIGMQGVFKLSADELTLKTGSLDKLSNDALKIMHRYKEEPWLTKLDLFFLSEMLGKGPKVFRPTHEQLIALEQMRVNVEYAEFNLPFELCVFELPESYTADKITGGHRPEFMQLYMPASREIAISNIMFMGADPYGMKSWQKNKGQSVEDWASFEYEDNPEFLNSTFASTSSDEERKIERKIRRAILNYCLLLDEVGIRSEGPESPNEYSQLVKWCKKNNKHTPGNKLRLRAQPMIYGLDKKPTELVRVVGQKELDAMTHEEREAFVSPHNRRGHWRHYRNDDGTLKFRRRIPPVMVNKHLLTSPVAAVYKT